MPGKYEGDNVARDEALHRLCGELWGNFSTGSARSPVGNVWLLIVDEDELGEVRAALDTIWQDHPYGDEGRACAEIVGAFVVREDSQGFVHVTKYPSQPPHRTGEDRALVAFQALHRRFVAWALTA